MYDNKMMTQVIDYQKTLFENSFSVLSAVQDQGTQMIDMVMDKSGVLPESNKKFCTYWTDFFKQNRENYKTYMDTNFDRVKDFFDTIPTSPAPAKAEKKTK